MRATRTSRNSPAACGFANQQILVGKISNPKSAIQNPKSKRAFTLVEVLISLAICAALLTATGVAVNAALQGYQINQEQATLTQRARLCMYRMLTQIRITKEHSPYTTSLASEFATGAIVTDTGISMFLDDNTELSYIYNPTTNQLTQIQNGSKYVLLDGVQNFQIKLEPMQSADSIKSGKMTYDLLMRATILLTIRTSSQTSTGSETTGMQTITLSSSVEPRRNIW